jgi:serine/threonine-protein kinase RIM15
MEKLLEKLRCRTLTVQTGSEAVRYAMGEVKFDIIMMEFKLPQINGADVARMIRDTKNANSHTPIVAVTGYLKELQAPHHFDGLIEKPPTIAKLTEVMCRLCQWKAPPPNWTPTSHYPSITPTIPSSLRQESAQHEDSPTSNSSGFPPMPSGSYHGSSREDSISSSFFGDLETRTEDVPVAIQKHGPDDWRDRDRDLVRMIGGLGISEDPLAIADVKNPGQTPLPTLIHETSAPAVMEHTSPITRQRSTEHIGAKRRNLEVRKHESAESGDDEDEELGNVNVRAKSPKTRPKSSSKLGIEMLRTNSRGSVISVEELAVADTLASSPPPSISEDRAAEEQSLTTTGLTTPVIKPVSITTPPVVFPQIPGDEVEDIDMDATPKPLPTTVDDPDRTLGASDSNCTPGGSSLSSQ